MKFWKDMTNEEKGALLLAYHEGAVIEYYGRGSGTWKLVVDNKPAWFDNEYYRVQPRTTTHQIWWAPHGATVFKPHFADPYTQLITFTLKGDECIDVKVEEL